jgi:RNA polymerase sigma factor (sigma-70 family)
VTDCIGIAKKFPFICNAYLPESIMQTDIMPTAVSREEVSHLRKGHRATEKSVFERLFDLVVKACCHYTPDRMKAEDAAAIAFIKAFTTLERFVWHHEGSFYAWIRKIAIRETLYEVRKDRCFLELHDGFSAEEIHHERADSKLDVALALELLEKLNPITKAVFLLINLEGFSHAECAETLGISESNSKQLLRRGRMKLIGLMENTKNRENGKLGS